jgi:cob(I)alamin adenosyltransferase
MKIYTKKGDKARTSILGESDVPKHNIRIEAYGTVDELNVLVGALRDYSLLDRTKLFLVSIQENLFVLGSHLASNPAKSKIKLPELNQNTIKDLEKSIDEMEENLPEMKNFILPGGHPAVTACHLARVVCRRAERTVITLQQVDSERPFREEWIMFLNRLSDLLFVLARACNHANQVEDVFWNPS